jgi:hypothetical protein
MEFLKGILFYQNNKHLENTYYNEFHRFRPLLASYNSCNSLLKQHFTVIRLNMKRRNFSANSN